MSDSRFSQVAVARARRAGSFYRQGKLGFYVRRVATGIVFRGPCDSWGDANDLIEVELADEPSENFEIVRLQ